jgi:hypothetical protein
MDRLEQYTAVQKEALNLFVNKNKDYGDSFANFGPVGVIVRMGDKINRLTSINKSSVCMVKTESIRDTLIDLHNYAAMAIMLMDEGKPEERKQPCDHGHEMSYDDGNSWGYFDDNLTNQFDSL